MKRKLVNDEFLKFWNSSEIKYDIVGGPSSQVFSSLILWCLFLHDSSLIIINFSVLKPSQNTW